VNVEPGLFIAQAVSVLTLILVTGMLLLVTVVIAALGRRRLSPALIGLGVLMLLSAAVFTSLRHARLSSQVPVPMVRAPSSPIIPHRHETLQSPPSPSERPIKNPDSPEEDADAPVPSVERPLTILERVYNETGVPVSVSKLSELPDWILPDRKGSDPGSILIESQRFATSAEAIQQIEQAIPRQFQELGLIDSPQQFAGELSLTALRQTGSIARDCTITWPLNVGGFEESVQQIVVEFRPTARLRQRIEQAMKHRAGRQRLFKLAAGFGAVTLFLGVSSLTLRRRARQAPPIPPREPGAKQDR